MALLLVVSVVGLALVGCDGTTDAERRQVDSLNALAYKVKYRSLSEAMGCVDEVLEGHGNGGYRDGLHEAWLNRGDIMGMRMEYDSAQVCYRRVLEESDNDLLCSVADVDMMSVCLMTSMSKEFYDYRSDAHERFANVEEAEGEMTEHQRTVWNSVRTQYHFVSINYFIKMHQDDGVREEFRWLDDHQELFTADTTQWAQYLFLRSLFSVDEGSAADASESMQQDLLRLLSVSRRQGFVYFEASALNSLASVAVNGGMLRPSRQVYLREQLGEASLEDDLPLMLAQRALRLARQYGNAFVETTALITLSNYYLRQGQDSLALAQMGEALHLINAHHAGIRNEGVGIRNEELGMRNGVLGGDTLRLYDEMPEELSVEMRWIADPAVMAVPDWMSMVREQLSIIYGAMGRKAESDYNHNIYFDILDATRQDLRVQQEEERLEGEESMLNLLLWGLTISIVVLVWLLWAYGRRSRASYRAKVKKLSEVIGVCQRIASPLPDDVEDEADLDAVLHERTDGDVERLFPQLKGRNWTEVDGQELKGLDGELFRVLPVFYGWMRQKGMQQLQFAEQRRNVESETYLMEKRLEESKRRYIEKLTSMSIVSGITPFIDRALHEMRMLAASTSDTKERLRYVGELVDKVSEYNDVLGHWVKIRQGEVMLHVENFALQPLLDTMKLGSKTFESRGVTLEVHDSESVVKADKALTLFMMNTLLDNARKYTPEGGHVTLCAEETEDYVEVVVKDTGHGMSAEDVETLNHSKVYDANKIGMQGEHADDIRKDKGFGFGLMNCKGIIGKYKKMGALFAVCEFGVESAVGKGSRFFFRLPKGVLKAMMCVCMLLMCGMVHAGKPAPKYLETAKMYADSIYAANVSGDYERAVLYADSAIRCINSHRAEQKPSDRRKMVLEGAGMAELAWWKEKAKMDYDLILGIRNEVAIAALALNRPGLYHYNNDVFTRLYKLTSTDPALEEYCDNIRMTNRNKKTTAILLGMLVVLVIAAYFFLYYRNNQFFIFNMRQFFQLLSRVFAAPDEEVPGLLRKGLKDIRSTESGGTEEETLISSLVEQFMDIHSYFSQQKVAEMTEQLELQKDECARLENEQQKVYVRNQIMDNCLSTLKHETMYYPHRIHQLVEMALVESDGQEENTGSDNEKRDMKATVADIDELLKYYKEVFSILSACAEKQMMPVLFKRVKLDGKEIGEMAQAAFRKQGRKAASRAVLKVAKETEEVRVMGDRIFMQTLIDNIVSLFFEHRSGGDLMMDMHVEDGFVQFAFTDTAFRYDEEELPQLFYTDHVNYDAKTDTLQGTQYLICRQIIREHDAYSPRRGCRIYVENMPDGQGSTFIFTLPKL